jgi:hypothetical protein
MIRWRSSKSCTSTSVFVELLDSLLPEGGGDSAGVCSSAECPGYASTRITSVSGSTPSYAIASAAASVSIAALTGSRSGNIHHQPDRVGVSGSTNVRMLCSEPATPAA